MSSNAIYPSDEINVLQKEIIAESQRAITVEKVSRHKETILHHDPANKKKHIIVEPHPLIAAQEYIQTLSTSMLTITAAENQRLHGVEAVLRDVPNRLKDRTALNGRRSRQSGSPSKLKPRPSKS
jgi:hypothetical protein